MMTALRHASRQSLPLLLFGIFVPALLLLIERVEKLVVGWEFPVSLWFEPYKIEVPSPQTAGPNIYLFEGRYVWRPFEATYEVVVMPVGDSQPPVCDNSERIPYRAKADRSLVYYTLSQFVGEPCTPPPGRYVAVATWIVHRAGFFDATVGPVFSNEFEITAATGAAK